MYRQLDVASRRMFLLLKKIFWRNECSLLFEVRQVAIHVLGYSENLATKHLKEKVSRTIRVLRDHDIISLPEGTSVSNLFDRESKGRFVFRLQRGAYFDRTNPTVSTIDSPLVEPLQSIGFEASAVARILARYKPALIEKWADVTLTAIEKRLVKQSGPAFFMDNIKAAVKGERTAPDWFRELRKQEEQQERDNARQEGKVVRPNPQTEDEKFEHYLEQEARDAFAKTTRQIFKDLYTSDQNEADVKRRASDLARNHLRQQWWQEHPEHRPDRTRRLGDFF